MAFSFYAGRHIRARNGRIGASRGVRSNQWGLWPPAFGSVVPNASGRAIPVAGFPDPGGAAQGVAGLARGTRPVNGSRVPAPPGGGAPPSGGPGAGTGTTSGGQHRKVLMKLENYDGSGSLETYQSINQFQSIYLPSKKSKYNEQCMVAGQQGS